MKTLTDSGQTIKDNVLWSIYLGNGPPYIPYRWKEVYADGSKYQVAGGELVSHSCIGTVRSFEHSFTHIAVVHVASEQRGATWMGSFAPLSRLTLPKAVHPCFR
mmetsp:Transcript_72351/g.143453  ORF Transcript_72351/g.143453 Transcript_72351/m.143453 type:complete len:104 (+) Transcript_72351:584-895(+)